MFYLPADYAKMVEGSPPDPTRLLVVDDTYFLVLIDPVTGVVWRTLDGYWSRVLLEGEGGSREVLPEIEVR